MNKGIMAGVVFGLMMVAVAPVAAADKGLAGVWEVAVTDGPPACLNVDKVEGKDVAKLLFGGGSPNDVEDLKIEGDKISFKAHGRTWTGKVEGDEMTGTAAGQDNEKKFTAKRFVAKIDVTGTWKFGKAGEIKLQQKGNEVTGELGGKKTMPITAPKLENGVLSFTLGKAAYKLAVKGDTLDGTITSGAGKERPFTAKRERAWGEPIELFNGKNLDGWKPLGDESKFRWSVKDGIMTAEPGSNIVSEKKFRDFKLHVEFRVPEKGNSGVYLRGRHEIQVEDGAGKEVDLHMCGSIYARIAPKTNVCKKAGEWQTFDVVLVGQYVTVVQNGETIIDNQEIQGITGGAMDIDENASGPIYLQGDHSGIEYRKITITPAKE